MASKQGGNGRGRGRFRKQNRSGYHSPKEKGTKSTEQLDETSPVIQAFRIFQRELDSRNDRNERIVKLSRDITIESKRIIFLLQRCAGSEEKEDVLSEAAGKFKELYRTKFYPLALELDGQDPYQYLRAYSAGLQEYIEAVTFYHYLLDDNLMRLNKIQADLTFNRKAQETKAGNQEKITECVQSTPAAASDGAVPSPKNEQDTSSPVNNETEPCGVVTVPIPPSEYMLGIADFTGELMRMAINSVGAGDLESPALVLNLLRIIHTAFTNFSNIPRELRQKSKVLSQSLQKVERACYTLRVRGSEIPKHMLADVFSSAGSMPMDSFINHELEEQYSI
ncbi:translin-associated protein x [Plakobranchus ocellatus]|uniref:Translin-associated protein x n=1 Tax=Plakobranchus ocellatus TaxID=259542 RepID=A0AAV3ZX21_9GAST|nr:translin-associated protein x [Plakobranchus ocellatus]